MANTNKKLIDVLTELGLTTGLQLCLDAGDAASYDPAAQTDKWQDVSGNAEHFYRGTVTGADAADPTFNGLAGDRSSAEYFSADGGDLFRLDNANTAWINALHKDNATWTIMTWLWPVGTTGNRIFGTSNNGNSNVGVTFSIVPGVAASVCNVHNGSGTIAKSMGSSTALGVVAGMPNFVAVSVDEAANSMFWHRNGVSLAAQPAAFVSPSAAAATWTAEIMACGNATSSMPATSRLYMVAIWSVALTKEQVQAIYQATAHRFPPQREKTIDVLTSLSLTTGLQVCLDAGDGNSYDPAVQTAKFLDTSGSGKDFYRGTSAAGDAGEMAFNGVANGLSLADYFSSDGGDYFRMDDDADTFFNSLHKDNALFTILQWYYPATTGSHRILVNNGNDATRHGVFLNAVAASGITLNVSNGSGTLAKQSGDNVGLTTNEWQFIGISFDEAANAAIFHRNGTNSATGGATYTSPSAVAATNFHEIGAHGNGTNPYPALSRLSVWMAWNVALTRAQMTDIYNRTAHRFVGNQPPLAWNYRGLQSHEKNVVEMRRSKGGVYMPERMAA